MNCRGTSTSTDSAGNSFPILFKRSKQTLDHYGVVEVFKQGKVSSLSIEGCARHETDDLSAQNCDVTTRSGFLHSFECARDAGPFVINEVHRHLDHATTLQIKSQRLHKGQPAVTPTHLARDGARNC